MRNQNVYTRLFILHFRLLLSAAKFETANSESETTTVQVELIRFNYTD